MRSRDACDAGTAVGAGGLVRAHGSLVLPEARHQLLFGLVLDLLLRWLRAMARHRVTGRDSAVLLRLIEVLDDPIPMML